MEHIFGMGIGLFLMVLLWPIAILICIISNRAKPPVSSIGAIIITVVSVITVTLLLIPREIIVTNVSSNNNHSDVVITRDSASDEQSSAQQKSDWMFVWRPLIILINFMALIFALIVIYKNILTKQITRPKITELNIKPVRPHFAHKKSSNK